MDEYFTALSEVSEKTNGKLAYGIARNLRKLSEELVEYQTLKNKAIIKHGERDENGNVAVLIGSEGYDKFIEEMKEIMDISHDVDIFTVKEEEVINSSLNAKEMLAIDFMTIS
jgi:hypothetical protein